MGRAAAIFLMKRDDLWRPGVGIKYGRRAAAITVFIITADVLRSLQRVLTLVVIANCRSTKWILDNCVKCYDAD